MPLFLFVVGVAMPFSLSRRLERGDGRAAVYGKALRRVAILWVLGMIAQGNLLAFRLEGLRLYSNTLQAIAAGYFIATVALVELRSVRGQAALASALLVAYWLLMSYMPAPGHVAGDYTPEGNLALLIDEAVLGRFRDGTHYTWILSSLGFGATVLMGVLAGHMLRSALPGPRKVMALVVAGLGCLLAGWAWGQTMPIIKHVWTSSMALWAGGWSLLLLALFYGVIDVQGYRSWAFPLVVVGVNSIAMYVMAQLLKGYTARTLKTHFGPHLFDGTYGPLIESASVLLVFWLICLWMYRNKIFVKI
jgi:predicted acyltransferase